MNKWIRDRQGRNERSFKKYNSDALDTLMTNLERDVKEGKIKPLTAALTRKLYKEIKELKNTVTAQKTQLSAEIDDFTNQTQEKLKATNASQKTAIGLIDNIQGMLTKQEKEQGVVDTKLTALMTSVSDTKATQELQAKNIVALSTRLDNTENALNDTNTKLQSSTEVAQDSAAVVHKNRIDMIRIRHCIGKLEQTVADLELKL